jgi:O-antigen ligase
MNRFPHSYKYDNLISHFVIISIIIFTIFYNIGAGIPLLFDFNPSIFNFTFKIIGSLLLFISILYSFFTRGIVFSKSLLPISFFWIIYSLRIVYDQEVAHVDSGFSKGVLYSYTFGGDLISLFALMFTAYLLNIKNLVKYFFLAAIFSNIIVIILTISKNSTLDISLFLQRSEFSTSNSNEDVSIINPITIGQNGGILIIFTYYFLINLKKKLFNLLLLFCLFLLGVVNLFLGASRGPTLFVIIILFIISIFNLCKEKINLKKLFVSILIITVIISTIGFFFKNNNRDEIVLINRFLDLKETATNTSQDERGLIYQTAWKQFLENPIIGDKFIENTSKWYPHNIMLESLMSTGIIGTSMFLIYIISFIFSFRSLYQKNELLLIYFVGLYYFLCCLTSGSLWNSIEIWIFPVLSIYHSKRKSNDDNYNLIHQNKFTKH